MFGLGKLKEYIKKKLRKKVEERTTITKKECIIKVYLSKTKFYLLALKMDDNLMTYRDIGFHIYDMNISKMRKDIFIPLRKKAANGCEYINTSIHFINRSNKKQHLEIPLPIFSSKILNPKELREAKKYKWWKDNLKVLRKVL